MKGSDNLKPIQQVYFDVIHEYRHKVSHQRRKIMRKLNYRKKRATFQGYDQIMNSTIEESRDLERNKDGYTLFFEESKFYAKPKNIEQILQRMETDDYSGPQFAFCSHLIEQKQKDEFLPFDYK